MGTGYRQPSAALATATGRIWVAEDGSGELTSIGEPPLPAIKLGAGGMAAFQIDEQSGLIGAASKDGGVTLFDGATGDAKFQGQIGAPVSAAAFIGSDGVLTIGPDTQTAELRYFRDFATVTQIPFGQKATRIALSGDAQLAFAYEPGSPTFSTIDIPSAQVVQQASLNDADVSEIAFTERAAFLATTSTAFVAVVDLKPVAIGQSPIIRRVPLGASSPAWRPNQRLLASISPSSQVLAVDRSNQTGWVVQELAAVGNMPPEHSTKLGGGVPLRVYVVDRSFRQVRAGRFETVAKIGRGGPHELVLTTGVEA